MKFTFNAILKNQKSGAAKMTTDRIYHLLQYQVTKNVFKITQKYRTKDHCDWLRQYQSTVSLARPAAKLLV